MDSILLAGSVPSGVPPQTDLNAFARGEVAAAWIGHATVLLRLGDRVILTDPVFSDRIGMTLGAVTLGLSRLRPPALDVDHLPPIDVVLLSHAHFDHLDRPSLARLAAGPAVGAEVVTAVNTRDLIPAGFAKVTELAWGEALTLRGVVVSAMRPEHWGARAAIDRHRFFNAYVIHGLESDRRVLFAGDTARTGVFDAIDGLDLAIFGIGAYEPWDHAHASPEQVWSMYTRLGKARKGREMRLLPMHHATFDLGERHVAEPMERMIEAAGTRRDAIVCPAIGDVWTP